MSSRPSRRPTIVDRLKKLFKPTRSATVPTQLPEAVESQRAPTLSRSRLYPLGNKSEGNIARKWSFSTKTNNISTVSFGKLPSPAKGAKWYIPNETTIFPLPAPSHPALRSQPVSPVSPITPSQRRARQPSLSTSVSSHGTSDLHTPNSALESQPRQQFLWIPEPEPKSGTITLGYDDPVFPTAAYRDGGSNGNGDGEGDGIYFNPYNDGYDNDGDSDSDRGDREAREGPDSAPVTKLENLELRNLELRSSVRIRNEVESIQDEEMERLTFVAYM